MRTPRMRTPPRPRRPATPRQRRAPPPAPEPDGPREAAQAVELLDPVLAEAHILDEAEPAHPLGDGADVRRVLVAWLELDLDRRRQRVPLDLPQQRTELGQLALRFGEGAVFRDVGRRRDLGERLDVLFGDRDRFQRRARQDVGGDLLPVGPRATPGADSPPPARTGPA